jgi:hypothetical protein
MAEWDRLALLLNTNEEVDINLEFEPLKSLSFLLLFI